jgi:NAD(P)-dependent dehydrogenase (short-subunit alcohol dehydrogenase family)
MTAGRAAESAGVDDVDLTGTTALVTGATDGIGRETALALGRLGATVLVHGRDQTKGEAVVEQLRELGPGGAELYLASFEEMETVAELARTVGSEHERLDVLVNNAGGYFREGRLTQDGIERTFAVNHLAPFVLTLELLPNLRAGSGRVVTVSSEAHRGGELPVVESENAESNARDDRADADRDVALDLAELQSTVEYSGWDAYSRSKLANVLFSFELADRLEPTTITANCCHPGVVLGSGFTRNMNLPARTLTWLLSRAPEWLPRPFVDRPADAAATQTYLAASPDLADTTGGYFSDCEQDDPDERAEDPALRSALWDASVELLDVELSGGPSRE